MSSPIQDDEPDKPITADSPRAGEEQRQGDEQRQDELRQDETLRLQEEVIAAAQQLERQFLEREAFEREALGRELLHHLSAEQRPRNSPQGLAHGLAFRERVPLQLQTPRRKFELAPLRPSENRLSLQDSPRGLWAPTLDPISMPPPPEEKFGLPSPGLVIGLFGAIGAAAAIALVVVRALHFAPEGPVLYAEPGAGKNRSFVATAENPPRPAVAETKVPSADLAAATTASVLVTAPNVAIAKPSVMTPPPSPTVQAAKTESAQPEPAKPATAVIPEPRPADSLSRDEVASLLKRGQDLIAGGDIASGRLMLTRAAQAGNAEASLALAGTFDPAVLANLRAVGVQPDLAKARAWYTRAAEQGSLEAKQRLQQSSALR
jgi:hypothetical protein